MAKTVSPMETPLATPALDTAQATHGAAVAARGAAERALAELERETHALVQRNENDPGYWDAAERLPALRQRLPALKRDLQAAQTAEAAAGRAFKLALADEARRRLREPIMAFIAAYEGADRAHEALLAAIARLPVGSETSGVSSWHFTAPMGGPNTECAIYVQRMRAWLAGGPPASALPAGRAVVVRVLKPFRARDDGSIDMDVNLGLPFAAGASLLVGEIVSVQAAAAERLIRLHFATPA